MWYIHSSNCINKMNRFPIVRVGLSFVWIVNEIYVVLIMKKHEINHCLSGQALRLYEKKTKRLYFLRIHQNKIYGWCVSVKLIDDANIIQTVLIKLCMLKKKWYTLYYERNGLLKLLWHLPPCYLLRTGTTRGRDGTKKSN